MSWCLRKMAHRKNRELEREKSTRKSARLNNICDNNMHCKTLERKGIKRLKENVTSFPVITRKTRKLVCSDTHPSKPEESHITDDNSSSDRSIIRTLTYSSSDSNASNDSKIKNTKNQALDKKKTNQEQYSGKEHATETSNSAILKSVTNQNFYNLRRRVSPRVNESGSETLKSDKRCSGLRTPQLEEGNGKTANKATLSSVTNKQSCKSYNLRKSPQPEQSNDKTLDKVALNTVTNKRSCRRSPRLAKTENNSLNNAPLSGVTNTKSYNLRSSRFEENISETSNNAAVLRSATDKESCYYSQSPQLEENYRTTTKNAVLKSVTNKKSYSLRSPRFSESSSETSNVGNEKITEMKAHLAQKTKVKAKRSKIVRKPSAVDMVSKKSARTPSFSSNQENGVKKPKVRKKGPVARKRELRAMLEKQDEGYEDDAFEGTPFRNRKSVLKCELSPVILDTSIQSISPNTEFRTPYIIKTPVNRLRPVGPLSSATSESDIMTPGLLNSVNRNDIDCYVNKLKRQNIHFARNRKIKSHTPLSKRPDGIIQGKSFDFNCNYSLPNSTTESEDCEDADYYWSDME